MKIKMNDDGMRRLEQELKQKFADAQARGEAKAAGQGPDAIADAVAAELKAIGADADVEKLRQQYRKAVRGE